MCLCEKMTKGMLVDTIIALEKAVSDLHRKYESSGRYDESLPNTIYTLKMMREELGRRTEKSREVEK